ILAAPYDDGIDKLTIEGNRITDVTAQAISLVQPEDGPGDMAMTAHIEGNTIERAGVGGDKGIGINVGSHVTVTIAGNAIHDYGKAGIVAGSFAFGGTATRAAITNNTIVGSGPSRIAQNGIQLGSGATGSI